jgi:DMSO/TMAO reductase YedYZ molybdopterin-dependent catalytic subunit
MWGVAEMFKFKQIVIAVSLVLITSFAWLVSSCTRIVTVTPSATVETPLDDSPPVSPSQPTTAASSIQTVPETTTTTETTTPAPTDFPPLVGNAPLPALGPAAPSVYDIDIKKYSLAITGIVNYPTTLSYAQIQSYPTVTEKLEIICPDIEDEWDEWTGVPVATLLQETGLTPGASEVVFTGADGYYKQLPLEYVLQYGIFLAYQMNGQPLTRDRGFPLRLVVPGNEGAYWPRWIVKIEVKPALTAFSNSQGIIRQLSRNIPLAGNRLCACLLVKANDLTTPASQKPL